MRSARREGEVVPGGRDGGVVEAVGGVRLDAVVRDRLRIGRIAVGDVDGVEQAADQCPDVLGWSSRSLFATIRWVVTNCPSGQRSASSTSTWPPAS
jgi:hypothetical protein